MTILTEGIYIMNGLLHPFTRTIYLLRLALCLCCVLSGSVIHAQTSAKSLWACGDDEFTALLKKSNPNYADREKINNYHIREYIRQHYQPVKPKVPVPSGNAFDGEGTPDANSVYTIPVVVHVVYPAGEAYGTGANISYAQIRSQIEGLNAAFARSYPDYNGQAHPAYAQNTGIRFCLARVGASSKGSWATGPGGTEYGVMRYPDNTGTFNHYINENSARQLLSLTHPQKDDFPFDKYLNIWLVSTIDGGNSIMGYAPRPIMAGYPLDGIVMRADVFGDNTTGGHYALAYGLTQGKILAHEMGHYFSLYHIFQGGCAGANAAGSASDACDLNGDLVCDIEPCTTQNVLCNSGNYNTCTASYQAGTTQDDMINDYMSYADDDCMNTFTHNQAQRMWATLQINRRNLWQPDNLANVGVLGPDGCVPPYLNASISVSNTYVCAGSSILFSNTTAGNTASSRQWRFAGGSPAAGTGDTITVTFAVPGNYKAYLTVSDGNGSRTDSVAFSVIVCHLDSSLATSAHWYFGEYCSLDFSSGMPVKTTTAFDHLSMHAESAYPDQLPYQNCTVSPSDSAGNLLFYSNGVSVWNRDHKKISTSSIFGKSDINASNGKYYVPYPGHPDQYFIVAAFPNLDESSAGVRFVTVDVKNNTVSPYQEMQHPSLPRRFSQYLTVVPHCNGTDYWIIVRGYGIDEDSRFYCFLVTRNGIDIHQTPVISANFMEKTYLGAGYQMKASRNGDKLLITSSNYPNNIAAALYDFDSRTGIVTNERLVPEVSGYNDVQSGASFSPSGDYFYLMRSSDFVANLPPYWLFQYRVSDLAYNIIPTTGWYFYNPFQLGPDNQLYIANSYNYLAKLSDPDVWGGATFNGEFIAFDEPTFQMRIYQSIPSFIDAKQKEPLHPDFTVQPVNCTTYTFSTICFNNYISTWDFGDGSQLQSGSTVTHMFNSSGTFPVRVTLSNKTKTFGSAVKQVAVAHDPIRIAGPDSICNTNKYAAQYYTNIIPSADYKWSVTNGSLSGAGNLSSAGVNWQNNKGIPAVVSVHVSLGGYCSFDAEKPVTVLAGPVFQWTLPDSVCITDTSLTLTAKPAGGVFSGDGLDGNRFIPRNAGTGSHELVYRYGEGMVCFSEIQKDILVVKGRITGTNFSWSLPGSICITDSLLGLSADPEGGRFSGDGVNGDYFFTYAAGLGDHSLTYRIGEDTGCYSEIQKTISVIQHCGASEGNGMPTGFTPNRDGRNDIFRIPAGLIKELTSFSIYNRWGKLVFRTQNLVKGWDGYTKEMLADAGTYIYQVTGRNSNGNPVMLSGTMVLMK